LPRWRAWVPASQVVCGDEPRVTGLKFSVAIMGAQPVVEYQAFSKATSEMGLKAALAQANARYAGLDG